jgi:hypothetical protein
VTRSAVVLIVCATACAKKPAPPAAPPPVYSSSFDARFPAPPRHRDDGAEHTWETCYQGCLFRIMCTAAWYGGLGDEALEVFVGPSLDDAFVLMDELLERDGRVERRLRFTLGSREYDWLFVPADESTFVVSFHGPDHPSSRELSDAFFESFDLPPGRECPSVNSARYDKTRIPVPPITCP